MQGFLGGVGCGKFFPTDGRCGIEIPPQQKPFHLAIHSYDLYNSMAVIDNIRFDVALAPECQGNYDPCSLNYWLL